MIDIEQIMKVFGKEIRIRIINILSCSDLYVCEIVEILGVPQSTISRHLALLKQVKLISYTKEGSWIKYSLTKEAPVNNLLNVVLKLAILNKRVFKEDLSNTRERIKKLRGCKISRCGG